MVDPAEEPPEELPSELDTEWESHADYPDISNHDPDADTLQPAVSGDTRPSVHSSHSSASASDSPPLSPPISPNSGRFAKVRQHAKGGLGAVYVAQDHELNRKVALKELHAEYADEHVAQERFIQEAELTGQLEHPGIVPIYGLGKYADGRPYYAMRFITGRTFRELIDEYHTVHRAGGKDRIVLRQLLSHFINICHAVHFAHKRGVIHRDLKPENVMVGELGETFVVDWGLAKMTKTRARNSASGNSPTVAPQVAGPLHKPDATSPGAIAGTPGYMSPEQATGRVEKHNAKTDVYCLGGILFCILANRPPHSGKDTHAAISHASHGAVPPARRHNAQASKALDAIAHKAMEPQPGARYQTAKAVAEEVERWLADEPVIAYKSPLWEKGWRWMKQHKTIAVTAATLFLCIGLGAALAIGQWRARTAIVREQIQSRSQRASAENQKENINNAIRLLAEAKGLAAKENSLAKETREISERLVQLENYRAFVNESDALLLHGVHGFGAQQSPDPIVTRCEKALARYGALTDDDWRKRLDNTILTTTQKRKVEHGAAGLLVMVALRTALFVTSHEAGSSAAAHDAARSAIALLDRAEPLQPPSSGNWTCRLLFYQRLGNQKKMDEAGRKVIEILKQGRETAYDSYLRGSVTLGIVKDPKTALQHYNAALSRKPDHYGAALGSYFCHQELGETENQTHALNRCLAINDDDEMLYYFRGFHLFELKRYNEAILDFQTLTNRDPNNADGHYWFGRCFVIGNDWTKAEASFNNALRSDATRLRFAIWRGLACANRKGRFQLAVQDAAVIQTMPDATEQDYWVAARTFSLVSGELRETQPQLAQQHAGNAMKLLTLAIQKGFIRTPSDVQTLEQSTDLDAIRDMPAFKQLLATIRKS